MKVPTRVRLTVWTATAVTLGSGVLNVLSVMGGSGHPERFRVLRDVFPLEFLHISRSVTLLLGFALIVIANNIYKRKRRALQIAFGIAVLSIVFHLLRGLDYEAAIWSVVFAGVLFLVRRDFTVRSSVPNVREVVVRLALVFVIVLIYGSVGLWLLEPRHFGVNFHWTDALKSTIRFFTLAGDTRLEPRTHYGQWFLDSLYVMGAGAFIYAMYSVFRPVLYQFQTLPHEREQMKQIIQRHGRAALDYFKVWPDKAYLFSQTGRAGIAYKVGRNVALALGDPVGPEGEIESIARDFITICSENDWKFAFYQTLPDFLPTYQKLGLKRLHLGQDAVVDLASFTLAGKANKALRNRVNFFERENVKCWLYPPPADELTIARCKEVSDEWLRIPGRRERTFTLGKFDPAYLRATPIFTVEEASGRVLAFANLIPSPVKEETTIDLMRRRVEAPNGLMDYLFVSLFQLVREQGFARFNLGMAPLAGIAERDDAGPEEKAVAYFFRRLNFIFSNQGLQEFKAKFASSWEPRYIIYRSALHLPEIGLALASVSELHDRQSDEEEAA